MAYYDEVRKVWRVSVTASRPGTKRRREVRDIAAANTRAGKRMAELAEARLRIEIADAMEARSPGSTAPDGTVAALAAAWTARKSPDWSPATARFTRIALRVYILPHVGDLKLSEITPARIEQMYATWAGEGKSRSARRRYHGIMKALFADAERLDELPARNPMTRVTPAGGKAPERHIPSAADVRAVIGAAASPDVACFMELAVVTGARRGSLLALRWRDVDTDAGTVTFAHAVSLGDDGPVIKGTKADRPYAVRITGPALDAVRDHRRRAIETAIALGAAGRIADLFVFSSDGGPNHWNVSYPSHAWRIAADRAGLNGIRLH
ncbi:MAG TPA: hypothetical protein VGH66_13945, partial [Acidimicrobiales bacterium]